VKFAKLRLTGFKSFVEPTELVIEPGLTGIVGPNGCGKSNLLEALRWAMGENSYKSMRASGNGGRDLLRAPTPAPGPQHGGSGAHHARQRLPFGPARLTMIRKCLR
jgi:energy-coupling factor transporter ATP-binding protein EcfA2